MRSCRVPLSTDRELNDVLVFLAVANEGSFTAAGKALKMPTSTVSRRVTRLEAALETRLLHRTTRKLSLSDAGRIYVEHARRSFEQLELGEALIADAHGEPRGRVRLTAPLEHSVTMQVVTDFLATYPQVELEVEFSSRSVNILEQGFDVGLSAGPLVSESVVAHPLMDSRLLVVASPGYLARAGRPDSPLDLSDHPSLVFGSQRGAGVWTFSVVEKAVEVSGPLVVNHMSAACDAAVAGLGIARLPELTVGPLVADGRLEVMLQAFELPAVPVWVTHAAGPYQPPAVRALVAHFKQHFAMLRQG